MYTSPPAPSSSPSSQERPARSDLWGLPEPRPRESLPPCPAATAPQHANGAHREGPLMRAPSSLRALPLLRRVQRFPILGPLPRGLTGEWAAALSRVGATPHFAPVRSDPLTSTRLPSLLLRRTGQYLAPLPRLDSDARAWLERVARLFAPRACAWVDEGEVRQDERVVALLPDGSFNVLSAGVWCGGDSSLLRCEPCSAWYFCDHSQSWSCQACGAGDGDKHLAEVIHGRLPGWPSVRLPEAI